MTDFSLSADGAAADAIERVVPELVADRVASKMTAHDATLWGKAAESEAEKRLGWIDCVEVSAPLVPEIESLRAELNERGVDHIVLAGMGGSSLAPEVITRTDGVELTVLDSTDPHQVRSALADRLERTALVVSSKSGSTLETDSQRRAYEKAFREAGIDPAERIVIVTDPGSPLEKSAKEAGYRVFNADPNVGGRFSALTAFGLVPSGLAGANIRKLLEDAAALKDALASDSLGNPGLELGAVIGGTKPLKDKLGIVADGTPIVGFADWAEQLIAESTGKEGKGFLPVVLPVDAPELRENIADLQIVRLVADAANTPAENGEVTLSGPLGAMMFVWEYAVSVAGRLAGINPFDQPDVESAKAAARGLLDDQPKTEEPAFTDHGIEARGTESVVAGASTVKDAVKKLLAEMPKDGYLAIQAYLDRHEFGDLEKLRDELAEISSRPVTFGWGPRFLHSTGQYHKGGPKFGVYLQITGASDEDLEIPDRPFTFGQLIQAQAQGDAKVLSEHGRPVLRLQLTKPAEQVSELLSQFSE